MREVHKAIVSRNDDPNTLGRIRVICQSLVGADIELPTWIPPKFGAVGWFGVPDVGAEVDVEIVISANVDETFGEASVNNPDMRWMPGEYSAAEPVPDVFTTNYPLRRGFNFRCGSMFFDDTEGSEQVTIIFSPPGDQNPINITVSKDSVLIDGPNAKLDMKVKTADLISGANQPMVRGTDLVTWLANFITVSFNTHTHGTGVGPSTPPIIPLSPPVPGDFLSTDARVK